LLGLASTAAGAAPNVAVPVAQAAAGTETAPREASAATDEGAGGSIIPAATSTTPGSTPGPTPGTTPRAAAESIVREESWPGYNNGFDGQRYSSLNEINTRNVASLRRICTLRLGDQGAFETGPLVIDDTMYVTTARTTVALDAVRCTVRWRQVHRPDQVEAWTVNRGAAYLDGRLFRGTSDGRVLALDAKTGALLWKTKVGEPEKGEAVPSAPIAWNGKVYVGMAVGDYGTRGRMLALDAASGAIVWTFHTIPMGKERGADTWKTGESAAKGGGATWSSYTLDTARGEVLVPVANPSPMLDAAARRGDNLFTNSLVALDARTGALKWWYQLIPADWHDWDLGAAAVLYKTPQGRELVAMGSKDGNVYAIDRKTRKLLFKTPVTTLKNIDVPFTAAGVEVCPGVMGGVEWNGPAFDPVRNQLYVGAVDWCATFLTGQTKMPNGEVAPIGGIFKQGNVAEGWVTALDAVSGKPRWQYHSASPIVAGVTPTAGGVVFTGDIEGNFLALESATGKLLFKQATGGSVAGGVVTYSVAGRQYVATTSGNISKITFAASSGSPAIMVFALNSSGQTEAQVDAEQTQSIGQSGAGQAQGANGADSAGQPAADGAAPGRSLYASSCSACHGMRGEGSSGPALTGIHARLTPAQVIDRIKSPRGVMPKLYPSPLAEADVTAVAAYVGGL